MSDTDTIAVSRRDLETLLRAADALSLEDLETWISADTLESTGLAVVRDATDDDREMYGDPDFESVVGLTDKVCETVNRLAPLIGYLPKVSPAPVEPAAEAAE